MKQKKHLFMLLGGLVLALALVAVPIIGALAIDTMPAPVDPQSWKLLRDTNWSDYKPNPVIDWMEELNTEGLYNSSRYAGGNETYGIPEHRKTPIKGAIIVVDFWDRPFLMLGDKGADLFGWHTFDENDTYSDYLAKLQRGDPVTHNPQRVVKDEAELLKFWEDFLNKRITDPTDNAYNHGAITDEFWREVSYGKWGVDLTAFGVYHLEGFEFEFGLDYSSMNDLPPTFRRGSQRNFVNESIAAANAGGVFVGDYDFFFICHSGYDESAVWQEFGVVQWANGADVPYEYGVRAKMDEVEEIFTAHPEYLTALAARGGYNQSTAIADAAAQVAAGTFTEFKFPDTDRTWANNYIGESASRPGTPGGPNTAPTRYVRWTSWAAAATRWASSSGYGGGSFLNSRGQSVPNIPYSQQSESNGMATYAHEFGHVVNLPDNYSSPFSDTVSARSEPWDLMARGCFAGPFGDHARWSVPGGLEADSAPVHMMFPSKKFSGFYDAGDVYSLSVASLKESTPVVNEVVARNIPMNNAGYYPQLEAYGLKAPNFYKAIELTFDSDNTDKDTLVTTGWSNTRSRAVSMSVEVVERTGYDSYAPDDGVILLRNASATNGSGWQVVDSHLGAAIQTMPDYYLNGAPVDYPIAHQVHLFDGAFKAGTSFTDTGYYEGSEYQNDPRGDKSKVISGDTVNEYYDAANGLHFYILERHDNPGKVSTFLSYTVGLLHDDGQAVGGDLELDLVSVEPESQGRVAVATFDITNTGDATDIIRVEPQGMGAAVLNNLYAIGAGETITVPVYVEITLDILTKDLAGQAVVVTASSESNGAKVADFTVAAEDLVIPDFNIYLVPDKTEIPYGRSFFVDVMLVGSANYTRAEAEIAFDADLLTYAGYSDLGGFVGEVTKTANTVKVQSVPNMNLYNGSPCDPPVRLVRFKFTAVDEYDLDSVDTDLIIKSVTVNPQLGVVGKIAAAGDPLTVTLFKEFVKGLYDNMELYPDWIGVDDQGLPTTMPIFEYNTDGYINEIVYVEVPADTDRDGKRDRITLWIRRPVTKEGFLCPVVMEFSPYHNSTVGYSRMSNYGDSDDLLLKGMSETFTYKPNNDVHLQVNPDTTNLTYDDIKYKGVEAWDPIWWSTQGAFTVGSWYTGTDNTGTQTFTDEYGDVRTRMLYTGTVPAATVPSGVGAPSSYSWSPPARWTHYFVRGYAMVYGQLLGNRYGEGITNSLHVEEWVSAAAAAKWFNGEAKAYTTLTGDVEAVAFWANGHVALDGASYPGTTPTVAAMAGVTGVKAIMPEAHVASWYEYYRSGGALHGPEGYGGEDMNLHSSYNFSRFNSDVSGNNNVPPAIGPIFPLGAQQAYVETQHYMMEKQDRVTADYNVEWDHRNLVRGYGMIADDVGILQTNGQQDWNVMPRQAYGAMQSWRDNFNGVHKIVSTLTTHASQTGRLVAGTDGVERGMLKWYLMFLDHFMLGLDNHVDELMYDVNIANNKTGVMEGFNYDTSVEERGTIIPGAHYQKIYLAPGPDSTTAGRLSFTQPQSKVEGFTDMNVTQQLSYLPRHPGAPTNISPVITDRNNAGTGSNGQGNETPTSNQINYCDDRVVGVNRTTTDYAPYTSLIETIDRPVEGRLMYISAPLTEDLRLSGTVVVHLNGAPTKATGNLTVALLEIGRIPRVAVRTGSNTTSTPTAQQLTVFPDENGAAITRGARYELTNGRVGTNTGNFKYVTWGHTDIQNPSTDGKAWFQVPEHNYTPNYYFQTTAIVPGQYYNYVVEMNPYNYVFEAGCQIAVMVYGTDALASPNLDAESTGGLNIQLGAGTYIDIPLILNEPAVGDAITVEVASATAAPDETVEIAYSVKDNVLGFSSFDLDLPFDSAIYTPVTVVPASALSGAAFAFTTTGNILNITATAAGNIVGDGELFTVTYKVNATAANGTTPLNVTVNSAKYSFFLDKTVDVAVTVDAGVLTVEKPDQPPTGNITVNFTGIKDATVKYYTNVVGWQTVGVFDDACGFDIPADHMATWGTTTVQVLKDGMWYTFSDLNVGAAPLELKVELKTITLTGIVADCNLGLAQEDWIYRSAPATAGATIEYLVFDNGKGYIVHLNKTGAPTIQIPDIAAGATVDLTTYF